MDRISREKRSWNMSRIKGKNTKPEVLVRSFLHRNGFRFRLHHKDLPGSPDIVLRKYNTVIFVHGCFWHRHSGCPYTTSPKTRKEFWENKFKENTKRDAGNIQKLQAAGWKIIVIWECELKKESAHPTLNNLKEILTGTRDV